MSTSLQFHLREIELRKEIEYRSLQQAALERDVIIASAAIYAGLATLKATEIDPDLQQIAPLLWWIPFLLAVYARARLLSHDGTIRRLGRYIMKCEQLLDCVDYGWSIIIIYLRKKRQNQETFHPLESGTVLLDYGSNCHRICRLLEDVEMDSAVAHSRGGDIYLNRL